MSNKIIIPLIILVSYLIISNNISGLSIYALDEAKNASCAREMMDRNDLIVPTFNYELRTDKPPLHYYFMILAYQVFGVNPFAARFFSVIMGVLTILITYLFTKKYLDQKIALYAVLVLISSLHFSLQFHMAVPDPYLIFFMTAGLFSFYIFYQERKKTFLYLFYVTLGLGVLTKGPVAVALPGLIILLFLLLKKDLNWKTIRSLNLPVGILLFLLIVLPWYVAVSIKTGGEWTREFFLKHNVSRFTDEMEGHGGIFLLTFAYVIAGLLPFSIYIIQSFIISIKLRFNDILLYCLITASVIIVFFALSSTKLPNYTVPAYPFIAIMIGYFILKLDFDLMKKYKVKWSQWFYLLVAIAFPAGIYIAFENNETYSHLQYLWQYFLILPVGAVIALIFIYRQKPMISHLSIAASFVLMSLLFFGIVMERVDQENPLNVMRGSIDQDQSVVAYKRFNPAFVFYLEEKVPVFDSIEELQEHIRDNKRVFVISRMRNLEELSTIKDLELIAEQKDLFETPTTILMKSRYPE